MSDYPMLISNKLHSFRNFALQSSMKMWKWTIPIFRYFRISPMEIPSMFYDFVEVAPDASEGID